MPHPKSRKQSITGQEMGKSQLWGATGLQTGPGAHLTDSLSAPEISLITRQALSLAPASRWSLLS